MLSATKCGPVANHCLEPCVELWAQPCGHAENKEQKRNLNRKTTTESLFTHCHSVLPHTTHLCGGGPQKSRKPKTSFKPRPGLAIAAKAFRILLYRLLQQTHALHALYSGLRLSHNLTVSSDLAQSDCSISVSAWQWTSVNESGCSIPTAHWAAVAAVDCQSVSRHGVLRLLPLQRQPRGWATTSCSCIDVTREMDKPTSQVKWHT